jgi:hypothetical protein
MVTYYASRHSSNDSWSDNPIAIMNSGGIRGPIEQGMCLNWIQNMFSKEIRIWNIFQLTFQLVHSYALLTMHVSKHVPCT